MRIRIFIVALLIVMVLPMPAVHAQDDTTWLYNQINALRASLGLHGYAWNNALTAAAQAHSQWMASTGNISHDEDVGGGPSDRALAHGYGGQWVSENIYGGLHATPQDAWNFWMNSGIHYAAITNATKNEVGIGIASADGMVYYTLVFGEGSGVTAPPPPQPQEVPEVAQVAQEAPPAQPQSAPVQPPPPTRPPIIWTPSPTIPSQTPTITWTPTYTWTPSPTATIPPPTGTPIRLATAKPLPTQTEVAILPSPTQTVLQLSPINDKPEEVQVSNQSKFNVRRLLPIIIAAQVIGIGGVLWRLWSKRG